MPPTHPPPTGLLTNSTGSVAASSCSIRDVFIDWDAEAAKVATSMAPATVQAAAEAAVHIQVTEPTVTSTIPLAYHDEEVSQGEVEAASEVATTTRDNAVADDVAGRRLREAADASAPSAPSAAVVMVSSLVDSHVMEVAMSGVAATRNPAACRALLAKFKAKESELGNGICNSGPWNTAVCGFDAGRSWAPSGRAS
jgi:hypothetical protein